MTPGDVLQRLYDVTGHFPRGAGADKVARCPNPHHGQGRGDRNPSMSVRVESDKVLIHCHVCGDGALPEILAALRLTAADLFAEPLLDGGQARPDTWMPCGHTKVAEYPYRDELGTLLYAVARCDRKGDGCQGFRQWRPDPTAKTGRRWSLKDADGKLIVRLVPFRLPELVAAVAAARVVWIVEGEKDTLAVVSRPGCVATCGAGGAGKGWQPEYTQYFRGADVCVVADRDEAGRGYAEQIVEALMPVARSIEVIQAKHGKDASDHFASGGTTADFVAVWTPLPYPTEAQ